MIEHESGRVSGSIDRARVAELYAQTNDDELKAHYREVLGESEEGQVVAKEDKPKKAGPQSAAKSGGETASKGKSESESEGRK